MIGVRLGPGRNRRELHQPADEAERNRRTYLDAYVAASDEPLDEARWHWFLAQRQLTEVAKRVVKGRADGDELTTVLSRLASRADG